MKKYFLIFLLTISLFSLSEMVINKIDINKNIIDISFDGEIDKNYKVKYDSSTYLLTIDLKAKVDKDKLSKNISNDYVDTILAIDDENLQKSELDSVIDNVLGEKKVITTTILIYFKKNEAYEITTSSNKLTISIKEEVKKAKKKIVLDAGHGGKDPGAIGNGYNEKDLALATILRLKEILDNDFEVILTRDSDFFVTLQDRANIANNENADLFVSIHLNASKKETSNGAEVFYFSKNPSAYASEIAKFENSFDAQSTLAIESSQFLLNDITYHSNQVLSANLAKKVLDNIVSLFGQVRRGIFGANFAVLRGTNAPAILIELGFITNKHESSIYSDEINQYVVAQSIADAIVEFFKE